MGRFGNVVVRSDPFHEVVGSEAYVNEPTQVKITVDGERRCGDINYR